MYVIKSNRKINSYTVKKINRITQVVRVGRRGLKGEPGPQGPQGIQGPQGDPASNIVTSVNTQIGDVVLDASDVGADPTGSASQALSDANEYTDEQVSNLDSELATVAKTGDYDDLENKPTIPVVDYPVTSVNTRTGAVTGLAEKTELDMVENELFQDIQDGDAATLTAANSYTDTGLAAKEDTIAAGTTAQYWRGDKTWQTLNKAAVGLGDVDDTSDADKPVSTAQAAAINTKLNRITTTGLFRAYTVDGAGVQGSTQATPNLTNFTILQRNNAGQTEVGAPTANNHATNKNYVDSLAPSMALVSQTA